MPADRGLGKLKRQTKLPHRELVLLEQPKNPTASRVRERREAPEDVGGSSGHISVYPDERSNARAPESSPPKSSARSIVLRTIPDDGAFSSKTPKSRQSN